MLQIEDAKYLKKKIKVGSLDVHPVEKALVINYELEATILGQMGDPMLGDKKECQKIIRLKSLNKNSDVASLAREVVEKCKLIHPSKINEVQHLIQFLKTRREALNGRVKTKKDKQFVIPENPGPTPIEDKSIPKATLNELDSYVEMLYEDIHEKTKGTARVLQLARNPDYLEELCHNEAVLGALARVLREDWKKSLDLSYNITYIFFCFSVFSNFHSVISHFKIGSLCMDIIEGELQKSDALREHSAKKRKEKALLDNNVNENTLNAPSDLEKSKSYQSITAKQDQVLRVCTYLLLNIAENVKVEEKMRRKNIVGLLIKMLERDSEDLLLLVVSFLKKLSMYIENKDDMADLNIIEKLIRPLNSSNEDLVNVSIRLLLNLSFDSELRDTIIKLGLLTKLVDIMDNERHEEAAVSVLYHLSVDDKCKSMFTYTDCIPKLMKLILSSGESEISLELMSLAINLALNKRNAQLICEGSGLKIILKRALKNRDTLLMKMVRNIAQHEGSTRDLFTEYVDKLCSVVSVGSCDEFVVECVAVLGNLSLPNLNLSHILTKFNFLNWIVDNLKSENSDELTLEVIILVGTLAGDEGAAKLLVDANILEMLINILNAKQEDDEMVLQILYAFYHFSRHDFTRENVAMATDVPAYLIDLMHDGNTQIREICEATLEMIGESDPDWSNRIQSHKFRWYNSQWLDMVEEGQANFDLAGEEMTDMLGQSYLHDADILLGSQGALHSDYLSSGCESESDEFRLNLSRGAFSDTSRSSSALTSNRVSCSDLEFVTTENFASLNI